MYRYLFIADNQQQREQFALRSCVDLKAFVSGVSSDKEAITLLQDNQNFDLIIAQYDAYSRAGLDVLEYLHTNFYKTPIIFFKNKSMPPLKSNYPQFMGVIHKFIYSELAWRINQNLRHDLC